jgi:hypothetical protein
LLEAPAAVFASHFRLLEGGSRGVISLRFLFWLPYFFFPSALPRSFLFCHCRFGRRWVSFFWSCTCSRRAS